MKKQSMILETYRIKACSWSIPENTRANQLNKIDLVGTTSIILCRDKCSNIKLSS